MRRRGIGYSGRRLIDRRRPHLSRSVEDRAAPPEGWPGKPAAARIPWLHDLYDWTMAQAAAPYALWMLALIAFVESSAFPIPPDVLLIPMVLAMRDRAWLIAGVCTLASVAGGFFGYAIGALLFDAFGRPILELYGYIDQFAEFRTSYNEWGAWIVFFAGLTPFPYKVITIASGVTGLDLVDLRDRLGVRAGHAILRGGGVALVVRAADQAVHRAQSRLADARVLRALVRRLPGGQAALSRAGAARGRSKEGIAEPRSTAFLAGCPIGCGRAPCDRVGPRTRSALAARVRKP